MQKTTLKTIIKFLFASLLTGALCIWVEVSIGWSAIFHQWLAIPVLTIFQCMAMTLMSHCVRGIRLVHSFLQLTEVKSLDYLRVVAVSFIHNAANFILPMRLGEIVLPALSRYQLSIDIKDSVSALLGIRLFDVHVLLVLVILLQKAFLGIWQMPLLLGLVGGLLILPFCQNIPVLKKIYPPQFKTYFAIFISYLLTLVIWIIKLIAFYWIFSAFTQIDFTTAAMGILIADLSSILPINGFASAGSYEAAFAAGLYANGSMHEALISAIINLHIFLLLSNILAAVMGWFVLALKR